MDDASGAGPDLVIRNGLVADGLGSEPFRADVAISGGVISAVGKVSARGKEEIDATGCLVTPGFVDVHTHYDGQAVWSQRFAPSSSHGVTTVVMGNCGVGFAPCRPTDHEALIDVMEGVEDIPELVMTKGLDWHWETFPQFLDAIESRPHDIDFAVYLPHSPLRLYAMGERGARREPATTEDLAKMEALTIEALDAGAMGFATSSIPNHKTGEGEFIPSYAIEEAELQTMASAISKAGKGIFQMVLDQRRPADNETFIPLLARLSKTARSQVTFTLTQMDDQPNGWRGALGAVNEANKEAGVRIQPQVFPRPMGMLLGFNLSLNPFTYCRSFQEVESLPLDQKVARLRDPEFRRRLLSEEPTDPTNPILVIARQFERIFPLRSAADYEPDRENSLAAQAARMGRPALELAYDLLLENDGKTMVLAALTNYADRNLEAVREMLLNEDTVVGLGDGGAHYGLICDASFPTFFLTHWTRDRAEGRMPLGEVVKALSAEPAQLMGMLDRGVIAPGYKADLNVIDYDRLTLKLPEVKFDLPGAGRRLDQGAEGYRATIVSGRVIRRNDQPTDQLPGRLVRGQKAKPKAADLVAG